MKMKNSPLAIRLALLAGALAALLAVHFGVARPWFLGWGATAAERDRPLPGDDIVPDGAPRETRAITIHAPAPVVWAWVTQLGQDRGGFYSYELLEDLAGCEMPSIERLDPSLQQWRIFDKLWMYPPRKLGGAGHAELRALEPGRALGFATRRPGTALTATPDGSWSFVVEPGPAATSRLLIRGRAAGPAPLFAVAFDRLAFEPMHFVMERRTMETIGALAEGRGHSRAADDVQVLLWTAAFVAFVASMVLVAIGRQPRRRLATFLAAGLLFQLLTFVQPSPFLGLPLVALLLVAGWAPQRHVRSLATFVGWRVAQRPVAPTAFATRRI
jgi:hypothetical protein